MSRKKDNYHHGDLRRALLEAGLAMLEQGGLEGLSLRRVAAAAGVSHAAPAHYFPSLKALLTALAAIGFERFDKAMARERKRADPSPEEQMRAAARGYATFASQNTGLFRLMFSGALLDWAAPELHVVAGRAFSQLEAISAPVVAMLGIEGEHDANEILKLVWSVAHGYAHLYTEGQMQRFDAGPGRRAAIDPPNLARFIFKSSKTM